MQTNLNKKYKDRDPLETVEIIKNFFKSEGYEPEIFIIEETKAGTFWCRVIIKDKYGNMVLGQNGKGATFEYCLASGYAELYERYCADFHIQNLYEFYQYHQKNKKELNYFHAQDEKFLTFKEILNSSSRLKNLLKISKNEFLKTIALTYDEKNKLPCSYFYNLDPTKEGKYFNELLITQLVGSDGTAAGNTIEEAITQGLSEVYEHYVIEQVLIKQNIQTYYELDLNSLSLPFYLINLLYNIKNKDNISFHVFDLSYNFNMPVLLGTFHNKNTNTWSINLGAHPVFEIALERILTEIYQGVPSLEIKFNAFGNLISPFRNIKSIERYLKYYESNLGIGHSLPEEILLNSKIIKNYNINIFLEQKNYTNKELNNYFININKINNFEIFIKDISKSDQIKAVRVFVSNQDLFEFCVLPFNFHSVKIDFKILKIFISFFNTNNFDFKKYKFLKIFQEVPLNDPFGYIKLLNIKIFYKSLKKLPEDKMKQEFLYFLYLYEYSLKKKYSNEEIIFIFKNILLFDQINIEDIKNINNVEYWFKKLFLNSLMTKIGTGEKYEK